MLLRTLLIVVAALPLSAVEAFAETPAVPVIEAPPPLSSATSGLVVAADPRAQEAGEQILAQGGSATDAAIATMLALTLVEPQSSGVGGGGFLVRGTQGGTVETIDGRETAPATAGPDWFLDDEGNPLPFREAVLSGLSVGVPANIALAARAHQKHGRLPWAALFAPAITLATDGFTMNPRLYSSLQGNIDRAGAAPYFRNLFYRSDGAPHVVGTVIKNPRYADFLKTIAAGGPESFYQGMANQLASEVAAATPRPEGMTASDIQNYNSVDRQPVCGSYRGYKICGMGPPSSGGIAILQILGQIERFDLSAYPVDSVIPWHLFADSQRLAYADRELYIGDSDYVDVPVKGLIDPDYITGRGKLLDPVAVLESAPAGNPPGAPPRADGDEPPESGTTHFVVIGHDGTMVSYTSTIEGGFGSGMEFGGFYLNNELTDFSFKPEKDGVPVANRVQGGKRPRSSMAPTVIYDRLGKPFLAIGAAGGPTIPVQTARSIIGVIDYGLSIEDALALPFIMYANGRLVVEKGSWMDSRQREFTELGYDQITTSDFLFRTNAALKTETGWVGRYDPRLDPLLLMPGEDGS